MDFAHLCTLNGFGAASASWIRRCFADFAGYIKPMLDYKLPYQIPLLAPDQKQLLVKEVASNSLCEIVG